MTLELLAAALVVSGRFNSIEDATKFAVELGPQDGMVVAADLIPNEEDPNLAQRLVLLGYYSTHESASKYLNTLSKVDRQLTQKIIEAASTKGDDNLTRAARVGDSCVFR